MLIKIPHTLKIILPIIGWVGLCSFFAGVLIITTAQFDTPNALPFFFIFCFSNFNFNGLICFIKNGRYWLRIKRNKYN